MGEAYKINLYQKSYERSLEKSLVPGLCSFIKSMEAKMVIIHMPKKKKKKNKRQGKESDL